MSAPVQLETSLDDPRLYAPRWARERPLPAVTQPQSISSPPVASAPEEPPADPTPPRMATGVGGPNIEWLPRFPPRAVPAPAEFEGDIAVRALRRRLSLEPDLVPQPPIVAYRESVLPWITRLGFTFLAAAAAAFAVAVVTSPESRPFTAIKGNRLNLVASNSDTATPPAAEQRTDPVRLVVEGGQAPANEPVALGVSLQGASGGETVLLNGLASGTRLTSGTPFGHQGWRLMARDLTSAFAYAPRDYVGAMDAAVDVRSSGNRLLDSQIVRLEWIAKDPPPSATALHRPEEPSLRLEADEVARLLQRGQQFLQTGDVAAARLMLRRAAEAGSAPAALALGSSFDPQVLRGMGVLGMAPNVEQARVWYQKAADLGSNEAPQRIQRLQDQQ